MSATPAPRDADQLPGRLSGDHRLGHPRRDPRHDRQGHGRRGDSGRPGMAPSQPSGEGARPAQGARAPDRGNRSRETSVIPGELPDWASAETRQSLARDYAVFVGRILLDDDGAAGWDWSVNGQLRAHELPLVAQVATALPRGRAWSPHRVAMAVCDALDLHGA